MKNAASVPSLAASHSESGRFTEEPSDRLAALQVLIVDDDDAQREMVAHTIRGLGAWGVVEARCGHDGLVALQHMLAEVIVCDLDMLASPAVEFLRAVAERGLGRHIIICGREPGILAGVEAMAQAHGLVTLGKLTKPVTPAALRGALAPILEASRSLFPITAQNLRRALQKHEFNILYQPKVAMTARVPVGVEALARWTSHGATLARPTDFLPALTRHGLIASLTDLVVEDAGSALTDWQSRGLILGMAINIPVAALSDPGFVDRLAAQIAPRGIAPERFTLEVTETDMLADATQALDVMSRLRLKGFRLALDDFGSGYSSMRRLMMTPLTELKVDRSFVQDCPKSDRARNIVRSSIELAHRIGVTVVAEGVETQRQWDFLASLGCDQAQGYWVGTPMSASELPAWADAWSHRSPRGAAEPLP